ncbi:MAG: hypothetical protein ACD_28C00145G0008 [uncultured bacterium]|nr:MAG: hypothetical protein ACD_28C00145G0008 [uncultured bacterium]KKT75783.1 MAG: hypothetical protein UW70_C0028G0007 [Candidatus Peregrinibacteria bacterium GW2011_GWA2_44_7]
MKRFTKIASGVLLGSMLVTSAAFAASPLDESPFAGKPGYQVVNRILERKIGMDIQEVKAHLQAHDLKATLEADGVDVNALQEQFMNRVSGVLGAYDATVSIIHTEEGVEVRITSDDEDFLARGMILEARAAYFNQVHGDEAPFTVEAGSDDESLFILLNGESEEAIEGLQYRMPEYNAEESN